MPEGLGLPILRSNSVSKSRNTSDYNEEFNSRQSNDNDESEDTTIGQDGQVYMKKKVIYRDLCDNAVRYKYKRYPSFQTTRALFVGNLNCDIDINEFKEILKEESERENCTVERAWINGKRSHSYVLISDVPGAVSIRNRLNGYRFESSEASTYVDYIPVRALETWINQELDAPRDAIWRVHYKEYRSRINPGSVFPKAVHAMINYENKSTGYIAVSKDEVSREKSFHLLRLQEHSGRRDIDTNIEDVTSSISLTPSSINSNNSPSISPEYSYADNSQFIEDERIPKETFGSNHPSPLSRNYTIPPRNIPIPSLSVMSTRDPDDYNSCDVYIPVYPGDVEYLPTDDNFTGRKRYRR